MTAAAVRRIAALAAVAVLAVAVALYVSRRSTHSTLPAGVGNWQTAYAAAYTPATRTACGVVVGAHTIGVAHPVLPCGVELYLRFGGRVVLTHVIDRGHTVPGREFDLTPELARVLGVDGTQSIEWRFAR